jgi:hypothetical protein
MMVFCKRLSKQMMVSDGIVTAASFEIQRRFTFRCDEQKLAVALQGA